MQADAASASRTHNERSCVPGFFTPLEYQPYEDDEVVPSQQQQAALAAAVLKEKARLTAVFWEDTLRDTQIATISPPPAEHEYPA